MVPGSPLSTRKSVLRRRPERRVFAGATEAARRAFVVDIMSLGNPGRAQMVSASRSLGKLVAGW
eukprot:2614192-Lingulodinium_polyedra.AAC.1